MCGIAGEWAWSGRPPSIEGVAAMIETLAHRGPENRSCWLSKSGKLALAHAQLSFFKGAESQPVSNDQGTILAVCNGEIYNYQELTLLVRRSGINCEVKSDVQVIPYLFQLLGPSCFALLRGEFAFALFDNMNQCLYLVRDRFGI